MQFLVILLKCLAKYALGDIRWYICILGVWPHFRRQICLISGMWKWCDDMNRRNEKIISGHCTFLPDGGRHLPLHSLSLHACTWVPSPTHSLLDTSPLSVSQSLYLSCFPSPHVEVQALHLLQLPHVDITTTENKREGLPYNSSYSRFTLRVIASLITISSQYILTLASPRAGQHQNNTWERW